MSSVQLLRVSVHERISAAAEDFLLRVEKGDEAAEIPLLRALLTERLMAAAEEIVALCEEIMADYKERIEQTEQEICRQKKLIDAAPKPEVKLNTADAPQLLVIEEEVPVEQSDPEPPRIKEEEEEICINQEGDQDQEFQEADITMFTFTSVPVKSESDEEKPLHQRESELMTTEVDGEDCGEPEPTRNSDPDGHLQPISEDDSGSETDDSHDWEETRETRSRSKLLKIINAAKTQFECPECGKTFVSKEVMRKHTKIHTGANSFSCSLCKKRFNRSGNLKVHMKTHTGDKPFSCSVCKKSFGRRSDIQRHMRTHTGDKPFSCSVCSKSFSQRSYLQIHMRTHTREKPFCCSLCKKSFSVRSNLQKHMRICGTFLKQNVQQLLVPEEEVPLEQPDPEPPHIKEEQEELCINQEGDQHQEFQEVDITMFTFTSVPVKSEDDLEKPLHQRESELIKTEVDGEDCGEPEPTRNSDPGGYLQPVTDDSPDWEETRKTRSRLKCLKIKVPVNSAKTQVESPECGQTFFSKKIIRKRTKIHTGAKSFRCSLCKKSFNYRSDLQRHMRIHTGERPFSCSLCKNKFSQRSHLQKHMTIHTGEKPFSCSLCSKTFSRKSYLQIHMRIHRKETPQ